VITLHTHTHTHTQLPPIGGIGGGKLTPPCENPRGGPPTHFLKQSEENFEIYNRKTVSKTFLFNTFDHMNLNIFPCCAIHNSLLISKIFACGANLSLHILYYLLFFIFIRSCSFFII